MPSGTVIGAKMTCVDGLVPPVTWPAASHSSALNAALASITLLKSEPEAGTTHLSGARTAGFGHLLSTFSTHACGWTPSPSVQSCRYVCACRCLRSSW